MRWSMWVVPFVLPVQSLEHLCDHLCVKGAAPSVASASRASLARAPPPRPALVDVSNPLRCGVVVGSWVPGCYAIVPVQCTAFQQVLLLTRPAAHSLHAHAVTKCGSKCVDLQTDRANCR